MSDQCAKLTLIGPESDNVLRELAGVSALLPVVSVPLMCKNSKRQHFGVAGIFGGSFTVRVRQTCLFLKNRTQT